VAIPLSHLFRILLDRTAYIGVGRVRFVAMPRARQLRCGAILSPTLRSASLVSFAKPMWNGPQCALVLCWL